MFQIVFQNNRDYVWGQHRDSTYLYIEIVVTDYAKNNTIEQYKKNPNISRNNSYHPHLSKCTIHETFYGKLESHFYHMICIPLLCMGFIFKFLCSMKSLVRNLRIGQENAI